LLVVIFSFILIVWFSFLIVPFSFHFSLILAAFVSIVWTSLILFLFLKSTCFLNYWICFIRVWCSWIRISSTFSFNKWIVFFFKRKLRLPNWIFISIEVSRPCWRLWRLISRSFRSCIGIFCTWIILSRNNIIFIVIIRLLKVACIWSRTLVIIKTHRISNLILTWIIMLLFIWQFFTAILIHLILKVSFFINAVYIWAIIHFHRKHCFRS
jgi:hypothetical protein